jgi:rhodanese-related sulfurtransferase
MSIFRFVKDKFNMTSTAITEISPAEAHSLAEAGSGVVVDVREHHEWSRGHAAGARHMPLDALPNRYRELPRDRTVLVICASGNRSRAGARYLASLGFDARSVGGGTAAWARAQLPLEA